MDFKISRSKNLLVLKVLYLASFSIPHSKLLNQAHAAAGVHLVSRNHFRAGLKTKFKCVYVVMHSLVMNLFSRDLLVK